LVDVADYADVVVDRVAQRGAWIAALLLVISIVTWFRHGSRTVETSSLKIGARRV
jgi:uncharacterized membrane protein